MDEKLKPCPFCGGEAENKLVNLKDGMNVRAVVCNKCGASGARAFTRVEATESWNTRAVDENPPLTLDELTIEKIEEFLSNPYVRQEQHEYAQYLLKEKGRK